jgi:fatty acid desaturase
MIVLAKCWADTFLYEKLAGFFLLVFMMTYNIIVISHLFTHTPWFNSTYLNQLVSILNSINIGQSVQAYHLSHVRNHHRYNNDQKNSDGHTNDWSSTFQQGKNGEHAGLFKYAFFGAVVSLLKIFRYEILSVFNLWRIDKSEKNLLDTIANSPDRRKKELNQIILDRMARCLGLGIFLAISWQWTLICYLPAFYLSLSFVNVQNYYEHYGAMPGNRIANSVSYYGKLYNLLTFNDGYHQEHHLRPGAHWSAMPEVNKLYQKQLNQITRIISPTPAILGFLHRKRALLHHLKQDSVNQETRQKNIENCFVKEEDYGYE